MSDADKTTPDGFCRIPLTKDSVWETFRGNCHKYRWVFRGMKQENWPLQTSLERLWERLEDSDVEDPPRPRRQRLEENLLREFKRRYHHYDLQAPLFNDDVEWLSLMQHHGAPTRLLDCTYSPYAAVYFATEFACEAEPKVDYAVWAVNSEWVINECVRQLGSKIPYAGLRVEEPDAEGIFHNRIIEPNKRMVFCVSPYRLNKRLTIQRGTFLCPGDISCSFNDNLRAMEGWDDENNVVQYVIPCELRLTILRHLFAMNMTRTTLFPGLDGFAQSLNTWHFIFENVA